MAPVLIASPPSAGPTHQPALSRSERPQTSSLLPSGDQTGEMNQERFVRTSLAGPPLTGTTYTFPVVLLSLSPTQQAMEAPSGENRGRRPKSKILRCWPPRAETT